MHFGKLVGILRVVDFIRRREMAHDEQDLEMLGCPQMIRDRVSVFRLYSKSRHARVELQDRRKLAPQRACGFGPLLQLFERVDDRHNAAIGTCGFVAGQQAVQHEDRCVARQLRTQPQRLDEMSDEEMPAATIIKGSGDLRGAEAIGIGLHDRGCASGRDDGGKRLIVAAQSVEIDGQITTSPALQRQFGRPEIHHAAVHINLHLSGADY